jgi:hypothetical protein
MDRRLDRKIHSPQLFAIAFLFTGAMNWSCALGECKLLLLATLPVTVSNNRPDVTNSDWACQDCALVSQR